MFVDLVMLIGDLCFCWSEFKFIIVDCVPHNNHVFVLLYNHLNNLCLYVALLLLLMFSSGCRIMMVA